MLKLSIKTRKEFPLILKEKNLTKFWLELGVSQGHYSKHLLLNGDLEHLYSIDRWHGDRGHTDEQYLGAVKLLSPFKAKNSIIRLPFSKALNLFPDNFFDFIYIDGYAHTGQHNGETLTDWWSKLKAGGIFAGHDYDKKRWPLTVAAVNSFSTSVDKKINITQEKKDKSWYVFK